MSNGSCGLKGSIDLRHQTHTSNMQLFQKWRKKIKLIHRSIYFWNWQSPADAIEFQSHNKKNSTADGWMDLSRPCSPRTHTHVHTQHLAVQNANLSNLTKLEVIQPSASQTHIQLWAFLAWANQITVHSVRAFFLGGGEGGVLTMLPATATYLTFGFWWRRASASLWRCFRWHRTPPAPCETKVTRAQRQIWH